MKAGKSREECLKFLRDEGYIIEPGQKFTVDYFRPEDALGVARLYYAVYGEMFPIDYVYDPEAIVSINEGDDLFQAVGRTPQGDVVGLYALFRSAPGLRIMEGGSWMVHPDYRKTSVGLRLARKIHSTPPEHLGLEVIFGQSVCDHVTSQKLGKLINGHYCALEIEPMPPRPGDSDSYGRISLLDGIVLLNNRHNRVYLPGRYKSQLETIYSWLDLDRNFLESDICDKNQVAASVTGVSVKPVGDAGVVKIEVESVGADFAECLAEVEQEYLGMHAYQLILSLSCPESSFAVETARKSGFFFGGLLPLWFDEDALLMQKISKKPDFTRPLMYTDEGKSVLSMVESDWKTIQL
jgi:hypothetical protein